MVCQLHQELSILRPPFSSPSPPNPWSSRPHLDWSKVSALIPEVFSRGSILAPAASPPPSSSPSWSEPPPPPPLSPPPSPEHEPHSRPFPSRLFLAQLPTYPPLLLVEANLAPCANQCRATCPYSLVVSPAPVEKVLVPDCLSALSLLSASPPSPPPAALATSSHLFP